MNDYFWQEKHKVFENVVFKNSFTLVICYEKPISCEVLAQVHSWCQKKDTGKDEWHEKPQESLLEVSTKRFLRGVEES